MIGLKICAIVILLMCFYSNIVHAKLLPAYIKKCKLEGDYNACILERGRKAIPHFLNGDKKYNVPSFNPLKLKEIVFEPSSTLKIILTDVEVSGFEKVILNKIDYDIPGGKIHFVLTFPEMHINSTYETKGRILVLPFEGSGPSHMNILNSRYSLTAEFDNMKIDSDKPVVMKNSSIGVVVERTIYKFDNLFNGNNQLGNELNRFLNDNQSELSKDFRPVYAETVNTVMRSIMSGVLNDVFYKDIFEQ